MKVQIQPQNQIRNSDLDTMSDYAIYANECILAKEMPLSYAMWGIKIMGWENEPEQDENEG